MKKKLLILSLAAICLAIAAVGTLTYFTSVDSAHNVITTGGIEIELQEWMENPDPGEDGEELIAFPADGITDVMPGTSVSKIVRVKNIGSNPAYIRLQVDKTITPAQAEGDVTLDPDLVALNFNTTAWTYQGGYYYYNEALDPDDTTPDLFTTVTFDSDMDNPYQGCTVDIEITAYATQVANNGTSALTATLW